MIAAVRFHAATLMYLLPTIRPTFCIFSICDRGRRICLDSITALNAGELGSNFDDDKCGLPRPILGILKVKTAFLNDGNIISKTFLLF